MSWKRPPAKGAVLCPKLLAALRRNVRRVASHRAVLGYYICDDCCANATDISLMAQAYNVIKEEDPYHVTVAGIVTSLVHNSQRVLAKKINLGKAS